jgi:hypothetical protein
VHLKNTCSGFTLQVLGKLIPEIQSTPCALSAAIRAKKSNLQVLQKTNKLHAAKLQKVTVVAENKLSVYFNQASRLD